MILEYFESSDTLDIWFEPKVRAVFNTVDGPDEWMLLYYDETGKLQGMTIENASQHIDLQNLMLSPHFDFMKEQNIES